MHSANRNKQPFYYALYVGKSAVTDADGYQTGEYTTTYGTATLARGNISPARGTADLDQFGVATNYSRTIVTSDMSCPINQDTILWVGVSTSAPHNYKVSQVAKSLNSITIAIEEVKVNG